MNETEGLPDWRREPVGSRSSDKPCEFNSRSFRLGPENAKCYNLDRHHQTSGKADVKYQQPFIVVDQNRMRNAPAIAAALDRCCRENLQLLVPDGAGFEMSKSSQEFETWSRSLRILKNYPEFISVSRKLTTMLDEELASGEPCNQLVDEHATSGIRRLLCSLDAGDDSQLRELIDNQVAQMMPASVKAWSDHEQHKQLIKTMGDLLRAEMNDEDVRKLRKDPVNELENWLSSPTGIRFVFQWLKSRGMADEPALLLCRRASASAAYVTSLVAVAFLWLGFGGIESAGASKVTNDLHDIEYAMLGSLSVELLTDDGKLRSICAAVYAATENRINAIVKLLASTH